MQAASPAVRLTAVEEIAPGVRRLGTEWVNWYVVEAADGLVVVDCGFRGYREQLGAELDRVSTVVLTHHHPDHVGAADRIRQESGARVLVSATDAAGARSGRVPPPPGLLANMWRPAMLRYAAHIAGNGGLLPAKVAPVETFGDGDRLPGGLRVIATPGHTAGHCSLLAEDHGVLFAGDALCNVDFFTREPGVGLLPFNEDTEQARRSLARLEDTDAALVAFGHGDPVADLPQRP